MKRSTVFPAFIAFLILIGVGAWQLLLQKAPDTAPGVGTASVPDTNVVPHSNIVSIPAPEVPLALPNVRLETLPSRPAEVVGIGARIKADPNTGALMIYGALPNSPAAAAGLAGEFVIRKIDNVLTEGMKLQECVKLIRGVAGTKVRLELFNVDANEAMTVELTRQKLQL